MTLQSTLVIADTLGTSLLSEIWRVLNSEVQWNNPISGFVSLLYMFLLRKICSSFVKRVNNSLVENYIQFARNFDKSDQKRASNFQKFSRGRGPSWHSFWSLLQSLLFQNLTKTLTSIGKQTETDLSFSESKVSVVQ